jgi:hypothetical protein
VRRLLLAVTVALGCSPGVAQAYLPEPHVYAAGNTLHWEPVGEAEKGTTEWQVCEPATSTCERFAGTVRERSESGKFGATWDVQAIKPAVSYPSQAVGLPMQVGFNADGFGSEGVKQVSEAADVVRIGTCSHWYGAWDVEEGERTPVAIRAATHAEYSEWEAARWAGSHVEIIDNVEGPGTYCESENGRKYPVEEGKATGGKEVRQIEAAVLAKEVLTQLEENPGIAAVDLLNEPGGPWYWGASARCESASTRTGICAENELAYAKLLKATYEALHAKYGSSAPKVLASYDGGWDNSPLWGEAVWKLASEHSIALNTYVDGVEVHIYGGNATHRSRRNTVETEQHTSFGRGWYYPWEGDRPLVEVAHRNTGKPVYIGEVGWGAGVSYEENALGYNEQDLEGNYQNLGEWASRQGYVPSLTFWYYRSRYVEGEYGWGAVAYGGRPHNSFGRVNFLNEHRF